MTTLLHAHAAPRRVESRAAVVHAVDRPVLWVGALALLASIAVRLGLGPFIADDAYITFRYARHLAENGAFEYNLGERVLGTTTPLFTLLMAGALRIGWAPSWTAVALSSAADAALIGTIAAALLRAGLAYTAALTAIMLAVWPLMVIYAVAGLETSLYTALVYGALLAGGAGRIGLAGIVTGLAVLCRPDGGLAAIVLAAFLIRRPKDLAVFCGLVVAAVAPWLVFAQLYFGSPVPQSIVAKAALDRGDLVGLRTLLGFFGGRELYVGLSVCAAAGAVVLWRRGGTPLRLVLAWAALYAAAFTLSDAFSDYPWYFVPLMPIYLAAAAALWGRCGEWVLSRLRLPRAATRSRVAAAALAILLGIGLGHLRGLDRYLVSLAEGREVLYASSAARIAEASPGAVVAATEIGTIGYFHPGPILDLVGLVSPEAVGRPPLDVLLEADAAWIVTYDTHFERAVATSLGFTREYELTSRTPVSPGRALEVYRRRPR